MGKIFKNVTKMEIFPIGEPRFFSKIWLSLLYPYAALNSCEKFEKRMTNWQRMNIDELNTDRPWMDRERKMLKIPGSY